MRAAVCALAGTIGAPLGAPFEAGIRLRAASLPSGVQFGADNLGRLSAEAVVLLGAACLADRRGARCRCSRTFAPMMASPVTR
ncbi:MAG: hypothetical protein OXH75_27170 [Acidobacteria bacterium]|nr:hypothetical protein [Acidobacteriota bacterium]